MHAAWGRRTGFSDYAVPSYTPTVYNLISSRRQFVPIRRNDARVLVAAVPKPRNWQPLPFVTAEVEAIVRVLPSSSTATFASAAEGVEKPNRGASVQSVVDRVHENSILHLACHGSQNSTQPLESGFIMGDGVLTVSRLMLLNLPNAFMAFLSACETAKGDAHQPDQAIHLSAAVMFAGFKSVVGTLWSVKNDSNATMPSSSPVSLGRWGTPTGPWWLRQCTAHCFTRRMSSSIRMSFREHLTPQFGKCDHGNSTQAFGQPIFTWASDLHCRVTIRLSVLMRANENSNDAKGCN